jgi:hypothetical protein
MPDALLTEEEIAIARGVVYYRDIRMRFCKICRIYGKTQPELERLVCLYNQMLQEGNLAETPFELK